TGVGAGGDAVGKVALHAAGAAIVLVDAQRGLAAVGGIRVAIAEARHAAAGDALAGLAGSTGVSRVAGGRAGAAVVRIGAGVDAHAGTTGHALGAARVVGAASHARGGAVSGCLADVAKRTLTIFDAGDAFA